MPQGYRGEAISTALRKIEFEDQESLLTLAGGASHHLRFLERYFGVRFSYRGTTLYLLGEESKLEKAEGLVHRLSEKIRRKTAITFEEIERTIEEAEGHRKVQAQGPGIDPTVKPKEIWTTWVKAKTPNQEHYLRAIQGCDMVFCIGPAGTGKTYLAIAMAVVSLVNQIQKRIVLVRPAVEAGEKLGFLPGTLVEKVDPYMRPLYDSLHDFLGQERTKQFLAKGVIEIAPLAYMRGRTLNDAFIILDEAQNTSSEQMKMFLTRMGFGSKVVVTGDVTQVDIPQGMPSGLIEAIRILKGIPSISLVSLTSADVVRHPLVQAVLQAYEEGNGRK